MSASPARRYPTVAFLDRDGTIIYDSHFLSSPDQVHLLDKAAEAVARLNRAKIPVILVTSQSGIGRGLFTVEQYEQVHARLVELLAEHGAHLDASYYCPDKPDTPEEVTCRKPSPKLFQQAIDEHHLDMSNPVFIGDRWRDIAPMQVLGGSGYLIMSNSTTDDDFAQGRAHATVVPTLAEAVDLILGPAATR